MNHVDKYWYCIKFYFSPVFDDVTQDLENALDIPNDPSGIELLEEDIVATGDSIKDLTLNSTTMANNQLKLVSAKFLNLRVNPETTL